MKQRIRKKQLKKLNRYVEFKEIWNLDITIARFILPRLKEFKKNTNSHPSILTFSKWQEILDKMILSFNLISNETMFDIMTEKESEVIEKTIQEGLDLFRQYYFSLWI